MDATDASRDRRSALRHKVRFQVQTDRGLGYTRDFSLGGLYFITDARPAVGDHLRLRVAVPDLHQASPIEFVCRGEVLRVEDVSEGVGVGARLEEDSLAPVFG